MFIVLTLYNCLVILHNFFYSIGEDYANLYMTDGNVTGSPQSMEKRRDRAKLIVSGALHMLQHVMSKLFACGKLNILADLLKAAKCLLCITLYVTSNITGNVVRDTIDYQTVFNPEYLQAMQMDCFRVVAELIYLFGKLKTLINNIDNETHIIQFTRISLVTSRYLQEYVVSHNDFHAMPPPPYKMRFTKRSTWNY